MFFSIRFLKSRIEIKKRKQGNELINEIDMKLLKQINNWHLNMLDTIFLLL